MSIRDYRNSFVLWSTEESRAAGKVSVLGVFETVGSVAFFWWLAQGFGFYWLLLSGLALSFLVLLRSPESIARGRELFDRFSGKDDAYEFPARSTNRNEFIIWIAIFSSVILIGLSLSHFTLIPDSRVDGAAIIFVTVCVSTFVGAALGTAIGDWRNVNHIFTPARYSPAVLTIVLSVHGWISNYNAIAILLAALAASAFCYLSFKVVEESTDSALIAIVLVPFGAMSIAFGVALRATFCRFVATVTHLREGIPRYAANWSHLVFSTDLNTAPEIIPGLSEEHEFHFRKFTSQFLDDPDADDAAIGMCFVAACYVPSVLYRYYLKSTAWLYFPLVWLATAPRGVRKSGGKLELDPAKGRLPLDLIFALIAAVVVGFFAWQAIDWDALKDAMAIIDGGTELPFNPLLMLISLDVSRINDLAWLPFSSAVVTITTFIWSRQLQVYAETHTDFVPEQWHLWTIVILNRVKNGLNILWIFVGIYEVVFVLHAICELPVFMKPAVELILDPVTCLTN